MGLNHDPDSTRLMTCLESIDPIENAEICLATGCFMGYGLFDPAVHLLEEARNRFGTCLNAHGELRRG